MQKFKKRSLIDIGSFFELILVCIILLRIWICRKIRKLTIFLFFLNICFTHFHIGNLNNPFDICRAAFVIISIIRHHLLLLLFVVCYGARLLMSCRGSSNRLPCYRRSSSYCLGSYRYLVRRCCVYRYLIYYIFYRGIYHSLFLSSIVILLNKESSVI